MKARVHVEAGVCNFVTTVCASSEDDQHVTFDIRTDCEKIASLGLRLKGKGAIDAFQEINTASEGVVMAIARGSLKGCCAGCAVPVGVFKAMQVAAGLALPKDIRLKIARE